VLLRWSDGAGAAAAPLAPQSAHEGNMLNM
jgi:hypothetical protein